MKKIYNQAKANRSFRRVVRQWFSSLLKRQNGGHQRDFKKVMQKLYSIEGSIETMTQEIVRQTKQGK